MANLADKWIVALEAVLFIAYNSGSGAIASRDIAVRQGLHARYLEGLMQKLVKSGILRSMRGASGGYVLAKERRRISVADIYTALVDDAMTTPPESKTTLGKHIIAPVWKNAHSHMMASLEATSIADLCDTAHHKNIKKINEEKNDFAI